MDFFNWIVLQAPYDFAHVFRSNPRVGRERENDNDEDRDPARHKDEIVRCRKLQTPRLSMDLNELIRNVEEIDRSVDEAQDEEGIAQDQSQRHGGSSGLEIVLHLGSVMWSEADRISYPIKNYSLSERLSFGMTVI